jgi:hypothetical protein
VAKRTFSKPDRSWRKNPWIKRISITIFLGILFLFAVRNTLLHWVIQNKSASFERRYRATLVMRESRFSGISGILIEGLSIQSSGLDTLVKIDTLKADLKLLPLLLGRVRLKFLEVSHPVLLVNRSKGRDNISRFITKKKSKSGTEENSVSIDFGDLADRLLDKVFYGIPQHVRISDAHFHYRADTAASTVRLPLLETKNDRVTADLIVQEEGATSTWQFFLSLDRDNRTAQLNLRAKEGSEGFLPFLHTLYNLKMGLRDLNLSLASAEFEQGALRLKGSASVHQLSLNHWRLSPQNVGIEKAEINFILDLGNGFISMDRATNSALNAIQITPYLRYQTQPSRSLTAHINIPQTQAQSFFSSLPRGLFQSFEGIQTTGTLAYNLKFSLDESLPDSVVFDSHLESKKFRVVRYGNANFEKLNSDFTYTAFEKGVPMASFEVGPQNPDFVPLDDVSVYLKNAVLCSEDGDFYWHQGFNERAFRKSIATNFKEKRFKRGGSTISMQLVKNVFLTRNKTIARKLEEALIVWMIEHNRLVSKDRMLEVYLNIIEWGPGIYGIGPASRYYFNKRPGELSLEESIFLAMIIPRPKWFAYLFDESGHLKPYTSDFFRLIAGHLVRREIISPEQREAMLPALSLQGDARLRLKQPVDTLEVEEPGEEVAED